MTEYRIVKIISEYNVVVNCGTNHGIAEGQILEVFEHGDTVIDPVTNENLGTLDYIKAKLRVVNVFPNMCICENRDGEVQKTIQEMISFSMTQRVPLNVETTDISGGFEKVSKKIKIGDLVREVN